MKRSWPYLMALVLLTLWVSQASRPGERVTGCFDGYATSLSEQASQVRVISINMLHGFPVFDDLPQRLDLIAAEISQQEADIVLLQEVPWTLKTRSAARSLAEKTGMNYAYLRANGNRWAIGFEEGEAILSRYPIQETGFIELKPKAGLFEHRVVLQATLDTPLGAMRVYATHLTNGDPTINQGQAAVLSAFVLGDGFAILGGDFNAQPHSPQIEALQSHWVDAFTATPQDTCCVDDLTHRDQTPGKRIDYLFLSPQLAATSRVSGALVFDQPYPLDSGWLWASDHFGLQVTIEAVPSGDTNKPFSEVKETIP